ncbi:hypothetical protein [Burkholderia cepacia]|nr:hypothetical protein [Burkholderia cepacia]MCA8053707.1 hypothetical protein [Burkholderia cepacia]MCA8131987.1 hypothetical protein [Burkholderia cepacia]MDN7891474.1 hypothetical protein [Burkholderia cepacia]HEM7892604.1 hypothetical protein [Burkholderia cepacia]HEM8513540.1 hypothetical protein [Burkholderia cepacia]
MKQQIGNPISPLYRKLDKQRRTSDVGSFNSMPHELGSSIPCCYRCARN